MATKEKLKPRRKRLRLETPSAGSHKVPDSVAQNVASSLTPEALAYALPGGLAKLAYRNWLYNPFVKDMEDKLLGLAKGKELNIMFSAPPRHGKALRNSTPMLTTEGWTTHGKLKEGDFVFGPDGKPTMVVGLSKVVNECVPVHLSNDEIIWCHPNHEWTVYDKCLRKWVTKETHELIDRVFVANRNNLYLPLTKPVRFSKKDYVLDPYVLGYWLGNGNAVTGTISHNEDDSEPVRAIEKALGFSSRRKWVMEGTKSAYANFGSGVKGEKGPLVSILQEIGVYNNKHIPEIYLRGSIKQRLKLLAGLLDSDGYVDRSSRCIYVTTNIKIRDGVMDLCTSLGFRPYYRTVQPELSTSGVQGTKICYYIGFQPTREIPTKVPRKKIKRFAKQRKLSIISIGKSRKMKARSIMVDRPDGLYLAGKKLVPTHNTTFVSRILSAWFLGHNPNKRVLLITYQDGFSRTQSRHARNIFKNWGEAVFGLKVADDTQAANQWDIAGHEGGMEAVGAGGAITGKGADLLIIDDLIKGREQALNERILDEHWEWFLTDVLSRLEPGASVVIMMTRWTMSDLIGRILDRQREEQDEGVEEDDASFSEFEYFNYPAIALENDILGRKPGEVLFPARWNESRMRKRRARNDEYWWEALYQGNPVPRSGNIIDVAAMQKRPYKMNDVSKRSDFDMILISVDTAIKDTEIADFSVFGIWGVRQDGYFLLDIVREKMQYPALVEMANTLGNTWSPDFMLIEDKGSGTSLIQTLRASSNINVWPIDPQNENKVLRMQAESTTVKAGMVRLPEEASWLHEFLMECRSFPRGKKDQVDMLSQFLKFMRNTSSGIQMFSIGAMICVGVQHPVFQITKFLNMVT